MRDLSLKKLQAFTSYGPDEWRGVTLLLRNGAQIDIEENEAILLRDWLIEAFPLPPESGEVEINYDNLLPKQEVVDGRRIVRKLPPRSFEDVFPPDVVPPSPSPAMEERNEEKKGGGE